MRLIFLLKDRVGGMNDVNNFAFDQISHVAFNLKMFDFKIIVNDNNNSSKSNQIHTTIHVLMR